MVILITVGVMNVAAMVGLAALILTEKVWRWGPLAGRLARLTGFVDSAGRRTQIIQRFLAAMRSDAPRWGSVRPSV